MTIDFKKITEKVDRWRLPIYIVLTSLFSVVFYAGKMNEFPSYIHLWTQADRYALALGYIDNDFDLLHPQTKNLRPQIYDSRFVNEINPIEEKGITSVDLPIHEYIIAVFMKVLGTTAPWVFQYYNLLYGLVGLYFLMLLVRKITGRIEYAIFIVFYVLSSPVYTYYLSGFIPSITSLASFFISLYFYYLYITVGDKRTFYLSLFFITFSAITRFSYVIYLLAMVGGLLIQMFKNKKIIKHEILSILGSFLLIGVCIWHKHNLSKIYGSMFLSDLLPPDNFADFKLIISESLKNWKYHYLTKFHYLIILFVVLFGGLNMLKSKLRINYTWVVMIVLLFFAVLAYVIAMVGQYINHDYYFLDSAFPLFLLIIIGGLFSISTMSLVVNRVVLFLLFGMSVFMFNDDIKCQTYRKSCSENDFFNISKNDFIGSSKFLDSIGVSRKSKVLVLQAATPNASLLLMGRKGYTVLGNDSLYVNKALKWHWDYLVIQNRYIESDILPKYPNFIKDLKRVGGNRQISVYQRDVSKREKTLVEFLGLSSLCKKLIFENNFESINLKYWSNLNLIVKPDYSITNKVGFVGEREEFGVTLKYKDDIGDLSFAKQINFEGDFYKTKDIGDLSLVFSVEKNSEKLYYNAVKLNSMLVEKKWKRIILNIPFNLLNQTEGQTLCVYVWNVSRKKVLYDDFKISVN